MASASLKVGVEVGGIVIVFLSFGNLMLARQLLTDNIIDAALCFS